METHRRCHYSLRFRRRLDTEPMPTKTPGRAINVLLACTVMLVFASPEQAFGLSTTEQKCQSKLGKSAFKLSALSLKELGKCRLADISGESVGTCPSQKAAERIATAQEKLAKTTAKFCGGTCSDSGVPCISDALCPPLSNGAAERCTAGAENIVFDMGALARISHHEIPERREAARHT